MRNYDETIKYFMAEIRDLPLIPKDEHLELAKLVQAGDSSAFDTMVKGNLRLVVNIAKKYKGAGGLSMSDLIQEGCFGLFKAIKGFDPDKGFSFSSYAKPTIRGYLLNFIKEKSEVVKLSKKTLAQRRIFISLDATMQEEEGNSSNLLSLLTSEEACAEEKMINQELDQSFKILISVLSPRELTIIERRFGLNDKAGKGESLADIGKSMGLSRERVRQLEARALGKLKRRAGNMRLRLN